MGSDDDRTVQEAARWYARLQSPDCDADERRAFQTWLNDDERHRRAFAAVSRTAERISLALSADARLRAELGDAPRAPHAPAGVHARRWAAAACVLLLAGLAALLGTRGGTTADAVGVLYASTARQAEVHTLADGSVVHLDAGAELRVHLGPGERRIELRRGRAYFEVAHDAHRPFTVEAGDTRTVALGTCFEVRLQEQGVVVTLAEGSVAVSAGAAGRGIRETLAPGEQLVYDALASRGEKRRVDAAQVTAWSSGRLVFDGVPLARVLEDVNRYAATPVRLGDESLADIPIGGTFLLGGDAGAFVQALAAILPLRSEPAEDGSLRLYRRRAPHETD